MLSLVVLGALVACAVAQGAGTNSNETAASEFLAYYNEQAQIVFPISVNLSWIYNTNITDYNQQQMVKSSLETDLWSQNMSRRAAEFNTTGFPEDMQRQFFKIKDIGTAALEDVDKLEQLNKVLSDMETIYSTGRVCITEDNCVPLDPDLTRLFETSRDERLLRGAWLGWRDQTGKKMKDLYEQFVTLSNEAVQQLGYEDTGAYWRSWYESENFEQIVADLFNQLKPFYEQLHAYVRRRLKAQYGEELFPSTGHIPAHLLGNMWAQQWNSLQDLLMPYPNKPTLDVTEEMVKQGYTAVKIFQVADDFFKSLGLEAMPQEFWDGSMLKKPDDGRDVVCHASAWDFYNGKDFRVKQCTDITMDHLSTAHHEMGHVEYFLLYKDQPVVYRRGANPAVHGHHDGPPEHGSPRDGARRVLPALQTPARQVQAGRQPSIKQCTEVTMDHFSTSHHEMGHIEYFLLYKHLPVVYRDGANPGFHEAVGDVISLSVETPKHLYKIGLLPELVEDNETDTNFLMAMALQKIAFLPFGYLIDQWRWSVFRGQTTKDKYNTEWWKLRCGLQGVSPPEERTEDDFDPGAKYHIPANTPYIRYFVSFVLQFQFHKALCEAANHQGPLHTCDIYNSTEAGEKLRAMLSEGSSKVWTEPFFALVGSRNMSAQPLMDYFEPLMNFLKEHNGDDFGWEEECPTEYFIPTYDRGAAVSVQSLPSVALLSLVFLVLSYFRL